MLEDGFAGVVCFGSANAFGEAVERSAIFSGRRMALMVGLCYTVIAAIIRKQVPPLRIAFPAGNAMLRSG